MEHFGVLFIPFLLQTNKCFIARCGCLAVTSGWLQPDPAGALARRDKSGGGGAVAAPAFLTSPGKG